MNQYQVGQVIDLYTTDTDANGNLLDPSTLTLTVTRPNGTQDVYTYSAGQVVRDSTGHYHYNYTVPSAGIFSYQWTATGGGAGSSPVGQFLAVATATALGSPTLANLVADVSAALHGETTDLEQRTYLTQAITSTDTTLYVNDASQISRGLIEIDQELMWVDTVDQANNIVTLAPFGRAYGNSTAAAHTVNTMVVDNPRYPQARIISAVQETLYAVYPTLFGVFLDESNTVSPVEITYPVSASADWIIRIQWQTIGPSQMWERVRRYKFDPQADATAFPTGKSIDIYDKMFPGRPIKIEYGGRPSQLVNLTDTIAGSGLQDSVRDVLVYGACYRLVTSMEAARLQQLSVEQSQRDQITPPGAAANTAKLYLALYTEALQREALRLQKFYPTESHLAR